MVAEEQARFQAGRSTIDHHEMTQLNKEIIFQRSSLRLRNLSLQKLGLRRY